MNFGFQTITDNRSGNETIKGFEPESRIFPGASKTEKTKSSSFAVDLDSSFFSNDAYSQNTKTINDIQNMAQNTDVMNNHNYMALLSNTMSGEDYANVLENGFDFGNLNSADAVTIVDKIKSVLLESGVKIVGYNDDLDVDKLTQITGDRSFAEALQKSFSENDIPVTTENVKDAKEAFEQISEVEEIDDSAVKYLVLNEKEPTINNVYLAQHSTNGQNVSGRGFYAQETGGYYAQKADSIDLEQLKPQIEKVIEDAGLSAEDEKNVELAKWTIEQGIPLTSDNLEAIKKIKDIEFPVTSELGAKAIAAAIADGKEAKEGNLSDPVSNIQREITARLKLEEVRLEMSVKANNQHLDSDFAIDIKPMEEFINRLKSELALEASEYAGRIIDEKTDVVPETRETIFSMTLTRIDVIKSGPADISGVLLTESESLTLSEISIKSENLTEKYKAAEENYEKFMTTPRADLGDSISKAFRNVDDILADLNQEINDENRRAVRILGYNSLEINEENFEKVRAYDLRLQETVQRLKPGAVLDLIRHGKNPLGMTIDEITKDLDQNQSGQSKDGDSGRKSDEKYAKFLYKLEKKGEITQEEKTSFIGIYRLFHTLKTTDYKAIGDLIKTGKDMTLGNLLDATRTQKAAQRGLDITADDELVGVESREIHGVARIDEQINSAFIFYKAHADIVYENLEPEKLKQVHFTNATLLPEFSKDLQKAELDQKLERDYREETLRQIRTITSSKAASGAVDELDLEKIELTYNNLEAMIANRRSRKNGQLWERSADIEESIRDDEEELLASMDDEGYEDAYKEMLSSISEKLSEALQSTEDNYIDVRAITLMQKQISVLSKASDSGSFDIPVEIDGVKVSMHVTLKQDDSNRSRMDASIQTDEYGLLTASLYEENGEIQGMLTTTLAQTSEQTAYLENVREKLCVSLSGKIKDIGVDRKNIGILYHVKGQQSTSTAKENTVTDTSTLLKMAKAFIEAL